MNLGLIITSLVLCSVSCFSQQQEIVGSWIWQDSVNKIELFVKKDGRIEQYSGLLSDYRWYKDDRRGTYTFKNGTLLITWRDESTESWKVTFKSQSKAALIECTTPKDTVKRKRLLVKVIDEEVIPDN